MGNEKFDTIMRRLDIILIIGFLLYALSYYMLNVLVSPTNFIPIADNGLNQLRFRLSSRRIIEGTVFVASLVYFVGYICLIISIARNHLAAVKTISCHLFLTSAIIISITAPFVLLDRQFKLDYVYTAVQILLNVLLIFFVMLGISLWNRRNRISECIE